MKKPVLLTAASLLALGAAGTSDRAGALPLRPADATEAEAYEAALASGSADAMQRFLTQFPHSAFVGKVFGELVQKVKPQHLERASQGAKVWYIYGIDATESRRNLQDVPGMLGRDLNDARNAERWTKIGARRAQAAIARCNDNDRIAVLDQCIADALHAYAKLLRAPTIVLPKQLKDLPAVLEQAAVEVRAAPTKKHARAAVQKAIATVHKQIELIKATEPAIVADLQTREGTEVVQTLEAADAKLERAIGL